MRGVCVWHGDEVGLATWDNCCYDYLGIFGVVTMKIWRIKIKAALVLHWQPSSIERSLICGRNTSRMSGEMSCNIYHTVYCGASSLIQAHYIGLSAAAGVRAPPGLHQPHAQLSTNNSPTMWQCHLRAWKKGTLCCHVLLPLLAGVPKD